MNRVLQLGGVLLALNVAGCATPFFSQSSGKSVKQIARAPVLDRSNTHPQTAAPATPPGTYSESSVQVGQLPREEPLTPREYVSSTPPSSQPYPTEQHPTAPSMPYPGPTGSVASPYAPSGPGTYPSAPAPSPGRTYPTDSYSYGPPPSLNRGHSGTALAAPSPSFPSAQSTPRSTKPATIPAHEGSPSASSSPSSSTPPSPSTAPTTSTSSPPASAAPETTAAATPPARPAQVPLPPAELTREGNQAVVALLENADKYVKSGDLDKAGAALERALRIEPRNAGIWHDLAQIRLHQNQYRQAESLAIKSNNLASGNRALQVRNWKLIAAARRASGNTAGAEEAEAQAALRSRQ